MGRAPQDFVDKLLLFAAQSWLISRLEGTSRISDLAGPLVRKRRNKGDTPSDNYHATSARREDLRQKGSRVCMASAALCRARLQPCRKVRRIHDGFSRCPFESLRRNAISRQLRSRGNGEHGSCPRACAFVRCQTRTACASAFPS